MRDSAWPAEAGGDAPGEGGGGGDGGPAGAEEAGAPPRDGTPAPWPAEAIGPLPREGGRCGGTGAVHEIMIGRCVSALTKSRAAKFPAPFTSSTSALPCGASALAT